MNLLLFNYSYKCKAKASQTFMLFTPMATTGSSNDRKQLHVAMFPWLAFGHIIPFLELSKSIAQNGHKVSFLSTTRNIQRLPTLPSHLSPLINLVKLTLPHVQELPLNAEATMDVRTDDIHYLKKAFDGLQPQVTRFLEEESPDWIIYDFAPYWLPPVAAGLGISRAFFLMVNAWFMAFMGSSPEDLINGSDYRKTAADFLTPPKWVPFPTNICYRKHEASWMVGNISVNASGVSDAYRSGMVLKGSDCIFIRHCYEFEPQWLTLLEKLHRLPVVPVGLMPPETPTNVEDGAWMTVKKWLDGQQKGRVVYVALGSEVIVSKSELSELALGLELSGLPFFWALREPAGSTESDSVELPDGFLERTRGRGMVWTSWVPQLQILSHESVGGFLTHCGWSSVVEGLMFGRPLIMLPFLVDQGLNARGLVDKQVGIEVPRSEEDGSITKDSVARSVSSVVVNDEGKIYKANAMELSRIFGDTKLQKKYVDDFIDYLAKWKGVAAFDH
ncbi:putative soyasaponin III rhamnosyltransferase [Helianthus annuus]|nr:putative soyasaponin III rhamnosyltransferase [Helianthus annuus]